MENNNNFFRNLILTTAGISAVGFGKVKAELAKDFDKNLITNSIEFENAINEVEMSIMDIDFDDINCD